MTTITLPRATVEQALEAMRCAVPTGKITLYEWDKAMADLDAALAQQAEPVRKPLTAEEIRACEKQALVNGALPHEQRVFFARAIERAHGII